MSELFEMSLKSISHYQITGTLGQGGMGIVYKAIDQKLKRIVAIKTLPPEKQSDEKLKKRLMSEALSASQLNHPNICTIYEVDEVDDILLIAMEYIEGHSLSDEIRKGPIEIEKVLDIAIQAAGALDKAHRSNIIHRDIKPSNIAITDEGSVKILDFGLARLITPLDKEAITEMLTQDSAMTETGKIVGTIAYMSPEQINAAELDARSDIFSFGVVLYEMLRGQLPFTGNSLVQVIKSILNDQPEPIRKANTKLPADFDRVIEKALAKNREDRYQTMKDLLDDLIKLKNSMMSSGGRASLPPTDTSGGQASLPAVNKKRIWIAISAISVVLLVLIYYLNHQEKTSQQNVASPTQRATKTAIAVLPFRDLSANKDQEYFSDGLTEELLNVLAKNPKLRVTSRTSAFSFKDKEVDIKTIAQKLNVSHVLEGSVRKEGDQLRITTQLIEVATDSHLWSQNYDRKMANIFAVQDDIAGAVAEALRVTLQGSGTPKVSPTKPEAYNAYLQGRFFFDRRSEEDMKKAVSYFEQALQIDPSYAPAWAALSTVYSRQADSGFIPFHEGYEKALKATEKALEIDPKLAEAHAQMGWIKRNYNWDWSGSDLAFKRALELEPENAIVIRTATTQLACLGRINEAISLARKTVQLDPLRALAHLNLGILLNYVGQLQESEAEFRKALELNPQQPIGHLWLGRVLLSQSEPEKAIIEMQKETDPFWKSFGLAVAYHAAGKKKEADATLSEIVAKNSHDAALQIAEIYAFRGEKDTAFEWLEFAYQQHDVGLTEIKYHQYMDLLKGDPRYTALLKKMGLPVD